MHNRLRMVTAMFLSKNLLIDWRLGEAWFMAHLVDGDLAANNGGWQWSASTGADAVPYFRVFNPLSQSRKFDPDGVFLREWLPELAHLPGDAIHDPSPMERAAAGYPAPIVDLAGSCARWKRSAICRAPEPAGIARRFQGPRRANIAPPGRAPAAHPKPTITSRRASLRAFTFCIIFKYLDLNQDRPGVRPR